jgi:hypothetical protein
VDAPADGLAPLGMTGRAASAPARLALLAVAGIAAAYQVQRPLTLTSTGPLSASTFRDFSGEEAGFRWSGAQSTIVFPDPGPGRPVRLEVALSGWRPRGYAPPLVTLTAGGRTASARPTAGGEVLSVETTTAGLWRSDLAASLRSDTFRPGPRDPRELGVRVEEARLVPLSVGLRRPPLGALVLGTATVLLIYALLARLGVTVRAAEIAGAAGAVLLSLGYAFARPGAALFAVPLLAAAFGAALLVHLAPASARGVSRIVADAGRALAQGGRRLADRWVAALVGLTLIAVAAAYRIQTRIEIDLGSGREVAVAQGFGVFDSMAEARCRRAPRGAALDLSDLGGGTLWTIEAAASIEGAPRTMSVLRADGYDLTAALVDGRWTSGSVRAPAPFGWRSGLRLTVPAGSDALRLDRVIVDRGRALPSLRIAAAVTAAVLLIVVLFGVFGLPRAAGLGAAAVLALGATHVLGVDPLVAIPFTPTFLGIVLLGTLLAAVATAVMAALERWGVEDRPCSIALGAAACGFIAWLTVTAFPLYRGGHFVFHSSIADEIWKGRFLVYYLPYPGSMLSEQAHWGNIKVPHPCLYQTLAAPLSALPAPWFYLAEKAVLALLFASLVIVAWQLAFRVAGEPVATFAALLVTVLVPTFQLLGLGHLMTILGVWASSLALLWLALRLDRLGQRPAWWTAVGLLTFCFLSYFAALLFTGLVLVLLLSTLVREDRGRARGLATAALAAGVCAFALYYVHWSWPFLSESIPRIVGGAGTEPTPLLRRLSQEPGKLTFSFGSMLIPLVGLAGLSTLPRSWPRRVLLAWGAVLVLVGGADLFFNFILKHHYYVIVPVAIGLAALLARMWSASYAGRYAAVAVVLALLVLAVHTAVHVATGAYPYHLGH